MHLFEIIELIKSKFAQKMKVSAMEKSYIPPNGGADVPV